MRGVWWSSFREMPLLSWPRVKRVLTMGRKPRVQARWREVLDRPVGE